MRRIIPTGIAVLLSLGLVACGGDTSSKEKADTSSAPAATSHATEKSNQPQDTPAASEKKRELPVETTAPDPCTKLTAEEASTIIGAKYTSRSSTAGPAAICAYKGADPLSPMLSVTANLMTPGTDFDSFVKSVGAAVKTEPKSVTIKGADEAKQLEVTGMGVLVMRKGLVVYQVQFGDPAKKTPATTLTRLGEAVMN